MTMNPFPPQAYTRETLVKAYQWLQNQNAQIKELATTPDLLISLYVKAKTQGEDFLDRPSLKTFKSELRNLAGMMGEFETHEPAARPLASPAPAPIAPATAPAATPAANPNTNPTATVTLTPPPNSPQLAVGAFHLDARSLVIVQEVKTSLNLSSDLEAVRLLISMGHNRLKNL